MTTEIAPALPPDMFGLVGTVLDRKFRVDRIVAEGGFGVVYCGVHLTLEKAIAIKVLKTPAEFNERARAAFIEKFALEGKTMARISHPNIVQVLDFGASQMPTGDLAPWMVLEWLTGQTLEQTILSRRHAGQGRMSPPEALQALRPVFDALAYAHDEGIAHRDIKPANMMVVQGKRGASLRLMDFGIAKLMEEGESAGSGMTRTRTTMNAFSPQYGAPEQISGTRTGPWTDVHAMALILTEILTGAPPYEGADMTALFGQILSPMRPTPGHRGVDVGSWEPVLARALTMKPDDRYRSMGEFLAALDAALPYQHQYGATTGSMNAADQSGPNNMVPMPFMPATSSPTTLRGSAIATGIAPTPQRDSRAPMFAGLGVVLALGLTGGFFALNHSRVAARNNGSSAAMQRRAPIGTNSNITPPPTLNTAAVDTHATQPPPSTVGTAPVGTTPTTTTATTPVTTTNTATDTHTTTAARDSRGNANNSPTADHRNDNHPAANNRPARRTHEQPHVIPLE